MAATFTLVPIRADGKAVSVKVHCPGHPQSMAGVVWRYNAQKEFEEQSGVFDSMTSEVLLGEPAVVNKKLFIVEGAVLHQFDASPTPYQVVVDVIQDGNVLYSQVPEVGGSGVIEEENVPFLCRFRLEAKK